MKVIRANKNFKRLGAERFIRYTDLVSVLHFRIVKKRRVGNTTHGRHFCVGDMWVLLSPPWCLHPARACGYSLFVILITTYTLAPVW